MSLSCADITLNASVSLVCFGLAVVCLHLCETESFPSFPVSKIAYQKHSSSLPFVKIYSVFYANILFLSVSSPFGDLLFFRPLSGLLIVSLMLLNRVS